MLNAIIKGEMLYFCQLDELGRVKISDPGQRLDLSNLSDPLPIKNLNGSALVSQPEGRGIDSPSWHISFSN